jgi:hypothetical protein
MAEEASQTTVTTETAPSMIPGGEPSTTTTQTSTTQETKAPEGTILKTDEPTSVPSWFDSLPEDLRKNEKVTKFKSVDDLARYAAEAKEAAVIPEADKYVVPETFPIKKIGEWANKIGLTQEQLNHIIALDTHVKNSEHERSSNALKADLDALLTTWGPQKDANIRYAKQVINHFDTGGELKNMLETTGAGNHPVVVKFFADLGKAVMAEDGFIKSKGQTTKATVSVADTIFDKR